MIECRRMASQAGLSIVGGNVRRFRNLRGYSQSQLATRTGLFKDRIGKLERGLHNFRLTTLETIAAGLTCSPAALVANDPYTVHGS